MKVSSIHISYIVKSSGELLIPPPSRALNVLLQDCSRTDHWAAHSAPGPVSLSDECQTCVLILKIGNRLSSPLLPCCSILQLNALWNKTCQMFIYVFKKLQSASQNPPKKNQTFVHVRTHRSVHRQYIFSFVLCLCYFIGLLMALSLSCVSLHCRILYCSFIPRCDSLISLQRYILYLTCTITV